MDIQTKRFDKGRNIVHFHVYIKVLEKTHSFIDAANSIDANLELVLEGPYIITDVIPPYGYKLDMGDSRKIDILYSAELQKSVDKWNMQVGR